MLDRRSNTGIGDKAAIATLVLDRRHDPVAVERDDMLPLETTCNHEKEKFCYGPARSSTCHIPL